MKQLTILFSCFYAFLSPTPVLAGIQNIRHMHQNANGSFNVICLNGRSETVDARTIANNSVCNRNGNIDNRDLSSNQEVICTGNEFQDWFWVTRVSDEQRLGSFGDKLSLKTCQKIVNASSHEIVCTGNEFQDWFYLTRISDGERFGERYSLETCLRISNPNQ